jgi:hypothetical protein
MTLAAGIQKFSSHALNICASSIKGIMAQPPKIILMISHFYGNSHNLFFDFCCEFSKMDYLCAVSVMKPKIRNGKKVESKR